jgi:hypothetical protein
MTSTAKYMKILLDRRHRPHLGPQAPKTRAITNNHDLDLGEKPPEKEYRFLDLSINAEMERLFGSG